MDESEFTDQKLLAYLDEQLPADEMSELETSLRDSDALRNRLSMLIQRKNNGGHSVGEIWRRERISCPDREQLGSYLLGVLDTNQADYIEFHVHTVGCRFCGANLDDLRQASAEPAETRQRRRKYFESSAGFLPGQE